jgi:small GTP-binding protein
MLRQIYIYKKHDLLYYRKFGKAIKEQNLESILEELEEEAFGKNPNEMNTYTYFKYRISYLTDRDLNLIFLFITGLTDDPENVEKELKKCKKEFLNIFEEIIQKGKYDKLTFQVFDPTTDSIHKNLRPKISLVGFSGVGKTTITKLIKAEEIPMKHIPTITGDIATIKIGKLHFHLWDFAGQEQFSYLWTNFIKGSDAVLLITDSTLENVEKSKFFLELINEQAPNAHSSVIANKQDLDDALPPEEIEDILGLKAYSMIAIDQDNRDKMIKIIADILEMDATISPLLQPLLERDEKMEKAQKALENEKFGMAANLFEEISDLCLDLGDDSLSNEFYHKAKKIKAMIQQAKQKAVKEETKEKVEKETKEEPEEKIEKVEDSIKQKEKRKVKLSKPKIKPLPSDFSKSDIEKEAPPEKPLETPPEKPLETPPEKPPEAPPEKPLETPPEKPPEAPPEKPPEAPPEKPPEAPPEKPPEAPPEKPPEAPPEKPPEAPPEKPPEAPPEKPLETPPEKPPPEKTPPEAPPEKAPEEAPPEAPPTETATVEEDFDEEIRLELNPEDFMVKKRPKKISSVPKDAREKLKTSSFGHVVNPTKKSSKVKVTKEPESSASETKVKTKEVKEEMGREAKPEISAEVSTTKEEKLPVKKTVKREGEKEKVPDTDARTEKSPVTASESDKTQKKSLKTELMDLKIRKAKISKMLLDFEMKELSGEISGEELKEKTARLTKMEERLKQQIKELEELVNE